MDIVIIITSIQSDRSAIEFGGLLARVLNAEITLLHVAPDDSGEKIGQQILAQAQDLLPDLTVHTNLCNGKLVSRVLTELRKIEADLVVIGEGQRVGLGQPARRSLVRAVLYRTMSSLLIVRHPRAQLESILICTGGRQVAEPVIKTGAAITRAAAGQATLLHVAGTIPTMYTGLGEIEESLAELLETDTPVARHLRHGAEILKDYGITAQINLRHGVVANEILREARLGEIDLIIIGAPQKNQPFRKWLLGDVSSAVIERSLSPVLIVQKAFGDSLEES